MMDEPKTYARVQQSWLADRERRLLIKIAKSLPRAIQPDHLTLLGVAGSVLCGAAFALSAQSTQFLWLGIIGLVVNWAGDSLDGNLARVRGTERPGYGFFVDHTSDIVSQVFVFIGISLSPYVRFETGCLLLLSYWLAAIYTFIRTISMQVFQISYFGIGPTEIRIGLMLYIVSLLTVGPLNFPTRHGTMSAMDLLAIGIFSTVMVSFVVMTIFQARRLDALDPKRMNKPVEPRPTQPLIALLLADKTPV